MDPPIDFSQFNFFGGITLRYRNGSLLQIWIVRDGLHMASDDLSRSSKEQQLVLDLFATIGSLV
jgi:hypothetical protein